jgi:hypothetical protein
VKESKPRQKTPTCYDVEDETTASSFSASAATQKWQPEMERDLRNPGGIKRKMAMDGDETWRTRTLGGGFFRNGEGQRGWRRGESCPLLLLTPISLSIALWWRTWLSSSPL